MIGPYQHHPIKQKQCVIQFADEHGLQAAFTRFPLIAKPNIRRWVSEGLSGIPSGKQRRPKPSTFHVLPQDVETKVVTWWENSRRTGVKVTYSSLHKHLLEYNIEGFKAGRHWISDFLKRHKLSLHVTKPVPVPFTVNNSELVESIYETWRTSDRLRLEMDVPVDSIANFDESNLRTAESSAERCIDPIGTKWSFVLECGTKISCTIAVAATGTGRKLPALVVFKGENQLKVKHREGILVVFNHTHYDNHELLKLYVKCCVIPNMGRVRTPQATAVDLSEQDPQKLPRPVLLWLDQAKCHKTTDVSRYCEDLNIFTPLLPAHATPLVQPIDRIYKSLKVKVIEYINTQFSTVLKGKVPISVWRDVIVDAVFDAWLSPHSVRPSEIIHGFLACGLSNRLDGLEDAYVDVHLGQDRLYPKRPSSVIDQEPPVVLDPTEQELEMQMEASKKKKRKTEDSKKEEEAQACPNKSEDEAELDLQPKRRRKSKRCLLVDGNEATEQESEKEREDQPAYEVEKILKSRVRRGQKEYLLKWKNYTRPNWRPARALIGCEQLINEFESH